MSSAYAELVIQVGKICRISFTDKVFFGVITCVGKTSTYYLLNLAVVYIYTWSEFHINPVSERLAALVLYNFDLSIYAENKFLNIFCKKSLKKANNPFKYFYLCAIIYDIISPLIDIVRGCLQTKHYIY